MAKKTLFQKYVESKANEPYAGCYARGFDLTGRRKGLLTVQKFVGKRSGSRHLWWECKCDCGNSRVTTSAMLNNRDRGAWHCGSVENHSIGYNEKAIHARFLSKIKKDKKTKCWVWTDPTERYMGYGFISVREKMVRAHRYSYEHYKGAIPKGMMVLHSCDNRACANPAHLRVGTHVDNANDAAKRYRFSSKYTPEIIKLIRADLASMRHQKGFQTKISKKYGISPLHLIDIKYNRVWKHVPWPKGFVGFKK